MVKPATRREVTRHVEAHFDLSERRACRLLGFPRSSQRYEPRADRNEALRAKLRELAGRRRRWGYRQLHRVLRRDEPVNHKRVYRLYREEGLALPRRRRRKLKRPGRQGPEHPKKCHELWAMDFVHDSLVDGRSLRALTVLDVYSRQCLAIEVDLSLPAVRVTRVLDRIIETTGVPDQIRVDNGPEFVSREMARWAQNHRVDLDHIQPGKPTQNAFIESFNGTFREECLNENWFERLVQARTTIEQYRIDYNEVRPHSSLGGLTPTEFANL